MNLPKKKMLLIIVLCLSSFLILILFSLYNKQIDFKKLKPTIVQYESVLLNNRDTKKAEKILQKNGYKLFNDNFDTLAYKI